ncbi:response regulator [Halalkalibacter krulwichiae]|uniref:Transcriptional regulatory protein CitB n=1 Tax=Halalkalibacter krulwichiae TaxID=199441 RepID=A0A1X9MLP2_9BACI|nr:response regulator [Halalkalibacter krulwichiae]ARK31822.1 Transcriptional regulatory protein CitB [Halalkalibacter krulwichiae]
MIKVFIVEDDPMVLEVNTGFLEKVTPFMLCGTAQNGKDAQKAIKEVNPDLILLDMFLPDISGLEVLKSLRQDDIQCDIIMITAARDSQTIHEVFRLGAVDYLVKPFRFDRFKTALDSYYKMWKRLNETTLLNQTDIDEMKQIQQRNHEVPKGLSETTLKQILLKLVEQQEPITAEQLATLLGMARVTVRRYLEHLEQTGKIHVQIKYGSVGRPSHHYYV